MELTSLKDVKHIAPADFHHWRALSINLLSSRNDDVSTKNELALASHTAEEILCLFEGWYSSADLAYLRDGLEKLIRASIGVSALLRRQLAYWFVSYERDTKQNGIFDTETMLDVDVDADSDFDVGIGDESSATVRFKIFPGLFKCGDADGIKYDYEQCYVKTKVKGHKPF